MKKVRTPRAKAFDREYNQKRHLKQREEVIRELGYRCGVCGAFRHPEFLEIVAKEGMAFGVPPGGRYLRSMRVLRREVIPFAMLICNECQKKGDI